MSHSILIVDDDLISSNLLRNILCQNGYNVLDIAHSGVDSIKKASLLRPDIIFMDIYMPGNMDGIQASNIIRERLNIPVVFITGDDDQDTFSRALKTNPTGYIIKPFQKENLIMVLEMAIYRHCVTEQLREKEELLAGTMKSIADAVISTTPEGHIDFHNTVAETLIGFKPETEGNQQIADTIKIIHEDGSTVFNGNGTLKKLETIQNKQANLKRHDGSMLPISYSLAPIHDEKKHFRGLILTFRDISPIKKAEQELKNMNSVLEDKVQQRTIELDQKNRLLQHSLNKEKEINEFRSKIVTTISHEFKTPLTTIFSSTELIERYMKSEKLRPKADRHIKLIKDSVELLTNHLTDILKFRQYETLKEINTEETNPREFFEKMVEFYREGVGKNHRLIFTHQNLPASVDIDQKLMRETTGNFISNAIKYSPQGSTIILTLTITTSTIIVSVKDEGVGISKEDQEQLFEYFYRAKKTENIEGSGVGLAIAKQAVELMNGSLTLESEPDKGSTFSFHIPLAKGKS